MTSHCKRIYKSWRVSALCFKATEQLSHLGGHDPDRARIAKMCRHPITVLWMSALQASHASGFRAW